MSEFIPNISWTEFQKLKVDQLKRLKSAMITSNGERLFIFVNGDTEETGYLWMQTEQNCQTANANLGETLEQILEEIPVTIVKPLKRKRRKKAKREKALAVV